MVRVKKAINEYQAQMFLAGPELLLKSGFTWSHLWHDEEHVQCASLANSLGQLPGLHLRVLIAPPRFRLAEQNERTADRGRRTIDIADLSSHVAPPEAVFTNAAGARHFRHRPVNRSAPGKKCSSHVMVST
jgi:hypothetical protein